MFPSGPALAEEGGAPWAHTNGQTCNYSGPAMTWHEYRDLRDRVPDLEPLVTGFSRRDLPARARPEAWIGAADRYRRHMDSTGQVTGEVGENIRAAAWMEERRRVMASNQRISDQIVAEKRSRTPAQRDSVLRAVCEAIGGRDCRR
jgi:hypothetical protein